MHLPNALGELFARALLGDQPTDSQIKGAHDVANRLNSENHHMGRETLFVDGLDHIQTAASGQGEVHHQYIRTVVLYGQQRGIAILCTGTDMQVFMALQLTRQTIEQ